MQPVQSSGDSFACCSRYQLCSNEKKCVIANEDYSQFCQYRKLLEVGKIFYGKNSIHFSDEKYQATLNKINSLTLDEKTLLNEIYIYCRHDRCLKGTHWTYSETLENLSKYGLVNLFECRDWVLENYKSNTLESLISDTKYAALWKKHKAIAKENSNFVLKNVFISWIKQNASEVLTKIDDKYRLVNIPDNGTYADEYLKDFSVYENFNSYIVHPLKNDTCFLKLSY